MAEDLGARLARVEGIVHEVEERAPEATATYRESLHRRLSEAGLEIALDDERLVREIGIFAERCDISEELTRLLSHIRQFRGYMGEDDPVGRQLDFLSQEMNREFNTISSKANQAGIVQAAVKGKTEVEKIREQVQNIE